MRTLILGLGNTLACDDGVGVYAARQAAALLAQRAGRATPEPSAKPTPHVTPTQRAERTPQAQPAACPQSRPPSGAPTSSASPSIDVQEAEVGGFALVDLLEGYDVAVILDAIKLSGHEPGTIVELEAAALPRASHLSTGHQIDLPTALALGAELGRPMPTIVHIIAIQVLDDRTFGEQPSASVVPAIAAAAERAVSFALDALGAAPNRRRQAQDVIE